MQSLFYGAAVAAVSGLLMGAGLKAPLAVEDFEPMQEITGFQTAELDTYAPDAGYVAAPAYAPVSIPAAYAAEDAAEAELKPAVYTVEEPEPAAAPAATYELTSAQTDAPAANIIRSADAVAQPAVVDHSQGFGLIDESEAQPGY
jgi:hypothetical protein